METNLSWCYAGLGDGADAPSADVASTMPASAMAASAMAVTYARRSLQHSREAKAVNVEVMALRCLARFQEGPEKRELLTQSITLAQSIQQRFNEAASLFDLVAATAEPVEQETLWQRAVTLLRECGVMGWVDGESAAAAGRSPQNPPCLPLIG